MSTIFDIEDFVNCTVSETSLQRDQVIIVGAGAGGLACAIALASRGLPVTVIDAAATPGGKIRTVTVGGRIIDAGPTVFTMRWVFDELFAQAGMQFENHVSLKSLDILARHAWSQSERLDLFADRRRAADAIGAFAGAAEARGFLAFCAHARDIHDTLRTSFMTAQRPSPTQLVRRAGIAGLLRAGPFSDMWSGLGKFFADPRLHQLFGRYATYCGSSPFLAPATLMLVAHVEQEGVWTVEGGMMRLAHALCDLAIAKGAIVRFSSTVDEILTRNGRISGVRLSTGEVLDGDHVVLNADADALAAGLFGRYASTRSGVPAPKTRSLSAMTFFAVGRSSGFPLVRHNVFFSSNYEREFNELFVQKSVPQEPTIYICAQDREDANVIEGNAPERLFALINAPATGDNHKFDDGEIASCETRMMALLARCGLTIEPASPIQVTTPNTFNTLFPGTGGALYGPATHGAMATFARPAARTKIPGLYLAGGSVHPGPGVPMAALSGRIAAQSLLEDLASTRPFHPTAMPGGMSMR